MIAFGDPNAGGGYEEPVETEEAEAEEDEARGGWFKEEFQNPRAKLYSQELGDGRGGNISWTRDSGCWRLFS